MGGIKRRKSLKRLERRIKAFPGEWPTRDNPGKVGGEGTGHIMKRPGSNRK